MLLDLSARKCSSLVAGELITSELSSRSLDCSRVTELVITNCNLLSLDGIELFGNLEILDASSNNLNSLRHLYALPKLRVAKFCNNRLGDLAATTINNGSESFPILATSIDIYNLKRQDPTYIKGYRVASSISYLDLSFNGIHTFDLASYNIARSLPISNLMLNDNDIGPCEGILALRGLEILDLSNNVKVEFKTILNLDLGQESKIFLNGTQIESNDLVNDFGTFFKKNQSTIVHLDEQAPKIADKRVIKIDKIEMSKVKERRFIEGIGEGKGGFAPFVYSQDSSPCELMTERVEIGREKDCVVKQVVRNSEIGRSLLTTQSTVADIVDVREQTNAIGLTSE